MELESHSKFRDKYYSIMNNQAKPFSKKMGMFTQFANRTKPEHIMNKVYEEIKAKGLTLKEYQKSQANEQSTLYESVNFKNPKSNDE